MPDQHLAVAVGAGPDADRRDGELVGDPLRDARRDRFEHEREAAGRLERAGVPEQRERLLGRPALGSVAAEHRRRLRREADVAHDRDPGADDRAHAGEHRPSALELHGVGARLLDEADRVPQRVLVRDLERAEGHVRDDERPTRPARDGARQHQHLVHRGRDGRVVAEHGHRRGVADEDEVDARLVGEAPSRRVVGGHHDDPLRAQLHLGELGERELPGSGSRGSRLLGTDAHSLEPPSRGTLSIRRVPPTRTAPARTGGSKSSTSST